MAQTIPLLVFTDLDGTLLDHTSYDWSPAKPAIEALQAIGAGIILASSKTSQELSALRIELALDQWPCIVENGAGILPAHGSTIKESDQYNQLRTRLNQIPTTQRQQFVGFGDMTDDEVAQATGLTASNAALARARDFSEPGIWHGSDNEKKIFLRQLAEAGISVQQGGRFMTLSFGANKADQVRKLAKAYQATKTVALGDAPNDTDMLNTVDQAVVVTNPHAQPLPELDGESKGRVIRTTEPGPVGWNTAILSIIRQFTQETKHRE